MMKADKVLQELRIRLERQRGKFHLIAEEPGLSLSWLSKFANGVRDNPTIRTLEALDRALCKFEGSDNGERHIKAA